MSKAEPIAIGIDLGTTNSAVAVLGEDGVPRILPIRGEPTLPSCVGIDPAGKLVVGRTALNQLVARPTETILSIKRRMGTEEKTPLGDSAYSPQEISSFILRELKLRAEEALGHPVSGAVVTVPAYFDERQRQATKDAAALAGLEVLRILNEPTAAALAYDADREGDQTLLIYDLGGGTFDVSVVVVEKGIVEVKASHGDTQLGGDDFDQLLIDHVSAIFEGETGINLVLDITAQRRLKVALEAAKRTLSDQPFVHVREEFLSGEHHLDLEISRADYEEMIAPLLLRTLESIGKAMTDAKVSPKGLDKVMLVGGSTRTPLVRSMLQATLGIEPRFEVDPDTVVALGAAVQAAAFGARERKSILIDVSAHTLSNVVVAEHGALTAAPIIRRNTPVPVRKSEVFFTYEDDQPEVLIEVQQGESESPDENRSLGEVVIKEIGESPAGSPIVVEFSLDLDGMLHVSATHRASGKAEKLSIDTHGAGHAFDFDHASENIGRLIDDGKAAAGDNVIDLGAGAAGKAALVVAKDLRKRAEALLARELGDDDRADLTRHLEASHAAVKAGDHAALAAHNTALEDIIFYLED
jgi:molecular chaperone DnaK